MQTVFCNVVRFEETDAQGVVFYGNYVTYQDEAVTNFMEEIGFLSIQATRDWDVHAVNVDLNYRRSATFRDRLRHDLRVAAIRESSVRFEYECYQQADDALVVDGSVTHVAVDESDEPTRVPDDYREAVVAFQDEPPDPV